MPKKGGGRPHQSQSHTHKDRHARRTNSVLLFRLFLCFVLSFISSKRQSLFAGRKILRTPDHQSA